MMRFIGREAELEGLKGLLKKKSASFVVLRGRRRIGKSRLAEEFAKSFDQSYLLTGVPPEKGVTATDQREEFARQMRRLKIPVMHAGDWGDLFSDLAEHCQRGRVLVVMDEITWMGSRDPTFLPKLKTIWDTQFKKNARLVLLIAGSNSTWIEENILSSTGFVGRMSHQLLLRELPLKRCSEFWGRASIDPYEKFKVLSVTGGVPRYLEEIRPELTAEQNLMALCFQPTGILFHEFDQIFSDLFSRRNEVYKQLVLQVAKSCGTIGQVATGIGRSRGGDIGRYLDGLVEAGFLGRIEGWDIAHRRAQRLTRYRVSDNYVRFYLRYIEPLRGRIEEGRCTGLPRGWKSILGLQFENLVLSNTEAVFQALQLRPDDVVWSGSYVQTPAARREGCQIDLLIQTVHRVLYVCEVKFSEREVPKAIIREVAEKARRLKVPRGFSVRHVLIHVNGVSEAVEHDDFFSNVIDFGDLVA